MTTEVNRKTLMCLVSKWLSRAAVSASFDRRYNYEHLGIAISKLGVKSHRTSVLRNYNH